jgi:uncharacterized lipoprotein YbaY/heat shock protein HslJ/uncharacterized lipoprotein NlpE involved in copper resistance
MLLRFATIAAAVVLTACQGIQDIEETIAEVSAGEIAGVWSAQGPGDAGSTVLVLDGNGRFGVLGEATAGSWEARDGGLVLSVARIPTSRIEATRLEIRELDGSVLRLEGDSPLAGSYRRADGMVGHLEVTARYPDKIALPPDAVVRIELMDVSRADAPSVLVAAVEAAGGGLVSPMRFHLHYPRSAIDPRMSYSVAASVSIGQRLWMRTTRHTAALTRGAGDKVELTLEGVRESGPGGPPASTFRPVAAQATPGDAGRREGLRLPATFAGAGITFTLWSDGTFRLRESVGQAERGYARYDLGRWEASGGRLWLRGRAEAPRDYRWLPGGGLEPVRPDGTPVPGTTTLGQTGLDPVEGPLWMTGELVYFADAPTFRECLSGRQHPVAMEGGWIDLERAYLARRPGPGQALLVGVTGRFVQRLPMEGEGTREFLRVEGFGGTWPESGCPGRRGEATLRNTRWQPLVIDGRLLPALPQPHRTAHVRLLPDGRVAGSGGCNMFTGSVTADEGSISFGADMASTLMACREPVQALEQAFFSVLERARRYRISGDRLDLFGAGGEHLAHLQATYLD